MRYDESGDSEDEPPCVIGGEREGALLRSSRNAVSYILLRSWESPNLRRILCTQKQCGAKRKLILKGLLGAKTAL